MRTAAPTLALPLQKGPTGGALVNAPQVVSSSNAASFHFHALSGLPCGCVAAAYRSFHWAVAMLSLEAKGPHCVLPGHEIGRVLELNDLFEEDAPEEEDSDEYGLDLR
jgi:hypothetical protein